jgi:hypothetical protein
MLQAGWRGGVTYSNFHQDILLLIATVVPQIRDNGNNPLYSVWRAPLAKSGISNDKQNITLSIYPKNPFRQNRGFHTVFAVWAGMGIDPNS